jgi:hypothetical protein
MPSEVFTSSPSFGANVNNQSVASRPPGSIPLGPRGLPCSVVCPPRYGVTIVDIDVNFVDPDFFLTITFSEVVSGFHPFQSKNPWVLYDDGSPVVVGGFTSGVPSALIEFTLPPVAGTVQLLIPEGVGGFLNANGEYVTPGVYPVTVP